MFWIYIYMLAVHLVPDSFSVPASLTPEHAQQLYYNWYSQIPDYSDQSSQLQSMRHSDESLFYPSNTVDPALSNNLVENPVVAPTKQAFEGKMSEHNYDSTSGPTFADPEYEPIMSADMKQDFYYGYNPDYYYDPNSSQQISSGNNEGQLYAYGQGSSQSLVTNNDATYYDESGQVSNGNSEHSYYDSNSAQQYLEESSETSYYESTSTNTNYDSTNVEQFLGGQNQALYEESSSSSMGNHNEEPYTDQSYSSNIESSPLDNDQAYNMKSEVSYYNSVSDEQQSLGGNKQASDYDSSDIHTNTHASHFDQSYYTNNEVLDDLTEEAGFFSSAPSGLSQSDEEQKQYYGAETPLTAYQEPFDYDMSATAGAYYSSVEPFYYPYDNVSSMNLDNNDSSRLFKATDIPNKTPAPEIPNKSVDFISDHVSQELKFLVDASPLNLPKEECITENGEIGYCQSAYDCGYTNGVVNGLCHRGMDTSAHIRTCCVYPSHCGYETNYEVTYFKNPDYPEPTLNNGLCHYRVRLLDGVCQLRVDFVEFSLKPKSVDGRCELDNRLSITSPIKRAHVPVANFCGRVEQEEDVIRTDLPHFYIHIDDISMDSMYVEPPAKTPYVDFKVKVSNYNSSWNLRISQILCDGAPLQSPQGCSQFYTGVNGTIKGLSIADIDDDSQALTLSACMKMDHSACAIKYQINQLQMGTVKNKKAGKSQLGYGLTCSSYLTFNGQQSGICGAVDNKEMILPSRGPQGFTVVQEANDMTRLEMDYTYLYDCNNSTNYFKYPAPKV